MEVNLSKSSRYSRKGIAEASAVRSRTMLKFCTNTIAIMAMLQIVEMVDLGVHAIAGDASVKYIRIDEVGLGQVSVPEEIVINEHQDARRKLQEAEDAGPSVDGEAEEETAAEGPADGQGYGRALQDTSQDSPVGGNNASDADPEDAQESDPAISESEDDTATTPPTATAREGLTDARRVLDLSEAPAAPTMRRAQSRNSVKYEPLVTEYDGAVSQSFITYVKLDGTQGVKLTPGHLPFDALSTHTDFTLMMWIKPDFGPGLEASPKDDMLLFAIDGGIWCKISGSTLLCGGAEEQLAADVSKLEADISGLIAGQWVHLTFSSGSDRGSNSSYIQISENSNDAGRVITMAGSEIQKLFSQKSWTWEACLGVCEEFSHSMHYGSAEARGFEGGIRELVLFGQYTDPETAVFIKNYELGWPAKSILYYRFDQENFLTDQIWGNTGEIHGDVDRYTEATDMTPQDVCPQTLGALEFFALGDEYKPSLKPIRVSAVKDNRKTDYGYTFSMTIRPTKHWCHTVDPYRAEEVCSIFLLDGVVMLYKTAPDRARFFFFAERPHLEKYSGEFEMPTNQWITIQLATSRYGGYDIQTYDAFGRRRFQEASVRDMNQLAPTGDFALFNNFRGFAHNFMAYGRRMELPLQVPGAGETCPACLLYYKFDKAGTGRQTEVENQVGQAAGWSGNFGSPADNANLEWEGLEPLTARVEFTETEFLAGDPDSLWYDQIQVGGAFDGITCPDGGRVMSSDSHDSYIEAMTDYGLLQGASMDDGSEEEENAAAGPEVTVEFWLKLSAELWGSDEMEDKMIFSMVPADRNGENTRMEDDQMVIKTTATGGLSCRPFGLRSDFELVYDDFSQENLDIYQWFHVSCTAQGSSVLLGSLVTSEINERYAKGRESVPDTDQFTAGAGGRYKVRVGRSPNGRDGLKGMQIKEVRVWNASRTEEASDRYRYAQLDVYDDVTPSGSLQVYLKLNSDNFGIQNLPWLTHTDIERRVQQEGWSLVPGETPIFDEINFTISDHAKHVVCPSNTFSQHDDSRHQYYCYESPVKEVIATIEAVRDRSQGEEVAASSELHWYFSVRYSSLADPAAVAAQMTVKWTINDAVAQRYIDTSALSLDAFAATDGEEAEEGDDDDDYPLQYGMTQAVLVPQRAFRDGQNYTVQVSYEVPQYQLSDTFEFSFVPLSCLYSEVQYEKDEDVMARVKPLLKNDATQVLMGLDAAKFTVNITDNVFTRPLQNASEGEILVRNDDLAKGCANTRFYNKFVNATLRVLRPNASAPLDYDVQPELIYSYGENGQTQAVTVIVSGDDQKYLPVNETLTLILDLWWTNEEYAKELHDESAVFRSAVHYVMLSPQLVWLVTNLETSDPFAIRGESITFDGGNSYLLGVREQDKRANLEYRWTCEPPFQQYCDGMSAAEYYDPDTGIAKYGPDECARLQDLTNPAISFSDLVFIACGGTFCLDLDPPVSCPMQGAEYKVDLRVEYTGDSAAFGEKDGTSSFTFYDVAAPTFKIVAPETMLVSATTEQALDLWWFCDALCADVTDSSDGEGYSNDAVYFAEFRVKWEFSPAILSGIVYQTQKLYKIPVGALDPTTNYTASVTVKHKTYGSRAQATEAYVFKTGFVPVNGTGNITPMRDDSNNELGEEFIASISGWDYNKKPGSTLKWRMWATIPLGDADDDDEVPKVQKNFPITPTWQAESSEYPFIADSLNPFLFELRDPYGEVSEYTLVHGLEEPGRRLEAAAYFTPDVASFLESPEQAASAKYAYMEQTTAARDESSNQEDQEQSQQAILDYLQQDLARQDDLQPAAGEGFDTRGGTTDVDQRWARGTWNVRAENAVGVLSGIIESNDGQLDTLSAILEIPELISDNTLKFYEMLESSAFMQEYSDMLSSLLKQALKYESSSGSGRRLLLQEDEIARIEELTQRILAINKKMLKYMCSSGQYDKKNQMKTESFDLNTMKFKREFQTVEDSKWSFKMEINGEIQSHIDFDTKKIMDTFLEEYQTFTPESLCLQGLAYKMVPDVQMHAKTYENLEEHKSASYQVYLMDNLEKFYDLGLLENWGINLEFEPNLDTFVSNQTVCMGYSAAKRSWSPDFCLTNYRMPEENTIQCLCHIFGEDQLTSVITDSSRLKEEQVSQNSEEEVLQDIPNSAGSMVGMESNDSADDVDTPASNEYVQNVHAELQLAKRDSGSKIYLIEIFLLAFLAAIGQSVSSVRDLRDARRESHSHQVIPYHAERLQGLPSTAVQLVQEVNRLYTASKDDQEDAPAKLTASQVFSLSKTSGPTFLFKVGYMHFGFSPIISHLTQDRKRLIRFCEYMLMVCLLDLALTMRFYVDVQRQEGDIQKSVSPSDIIVLVLVSQLLLQPWFSFFVTCNRFLSYTLVIVSNIALLSSIGLNINFHLELEEVQVRKLACLLPSILIHAFIIEPIRIALIFRLVESYTDITQPGQQTEPTQGHWSFMKKTTRNGAARALLQMHKLVLVAQDNLDKKYEEDMKVQKQIERSPELVESCDRLIRSCSEVIRKQEKIQEDQEDQNSREDNAFQTYNLMKETADLTQQQKQEAVAGTAKKNRTSPPISTTPSTQEDILPQPEIEELNQSVQEVLKNIVQFHPIQPTNQAMVAADSQAAVQVSLRALRVVPAGHRGTPSQAVRNRNREYSQRSIPAAGGKEDIQLNVDRTAAGQLDGAGDIEGFPFEAPCRLRWQENANRLAEEEKEAPREEGQDHTENDRWLGTGPVFPKDEQNLSQWQTDKVAVLRRMYYEGPLPPDRMAHDASRKYQTLGEQGTAQGNLFQDDLSEYKTLSERQGAPSVYDSADDRASLHQRITPEELGSQAQCDEPAESARNLLASERNASRVSFVDLKPPGGARAFELQDYGCLGGSVEDIINFAQNILEIAHTDKDEIDHPGSDGESNREDRQVQLRDIESALSRAQLSGVVNNEGPEGSPAQAPAGLAVKGNTKEQAKFSLDNYEAAERPAIGSERGYSDGNPDLNSDGAFEPLRLVDAGSKGASSAKNPDHMT